VTHHVPSPRNEAVTRANKTPPPSPQPLPTRPEPTCASAGCVSCLHLCTLPQKNLLFFASTCACQYPTLTATSRRGSSACFDGDIGQVIIDASLIRRCIATRGRGCRRQRIVIQQNKSMRGRNALASTDPPNEPITPAIARGHLLLDGQHPQ